MTSGDVGQLLSILSLLGAKESSVGGETVIPTSEKYSEIPDHQPRKTLKPPNG